MNKEEIINLVYEFSDMSGFSECIQDDDKRGGNSKSKIGTSQFRDIANLCKKAECIEEIKLFIKYKTSKGNGWGNNVTSKEHKTKKFGDWTVQYIEKIEKSELKNEKEKIEGMSKFLGYLFWQSKVIKDSDK